MAIEDLPEVGDDIPQPVYDQQVTNITALVLTNNAVENKLCGDLVASRRNAKKAKAAFNVSDADIKRLVDHAIATPTSPSFPQFQKDSLISGLNSVLNFSGNLDGVTSQIGRFIDHTNLMVGNLPSIGGILNEAISLPKKLTSAIAGALPSSFPLKIPSFKLGMDNLPIPNFSGLSLPDFPSINLKGFSIPGLPDITNLPGISIPGIPNPLDALKAFGGSILAPSFGGVGKLLSKGMKAITGGISSLAGGVSSTLSNMVSGLSLDSVGSTVGEFVSSLPSLPSLADIGKLVDLGGLVDGAKKLASAMGDVIGGELGAFKGMTCSTLSPGAACGGAPSVPNAVASANGIVNMAKTKTSAKLLSSVATPALAKQLPDVLGDKLPT